MGQKKWYNSRSDDIEKVIKLSKDKIDEAWRQKKETLTTQNQQEQSTIDAQYRMKEEHLKEQQKEQASLLERQLDREEKELIKKNKEMDDDLYKKIDKLVDMIKNLALRQFRMTHNICN